MLPLFALANAGVSLSADALAAAMTSRLTWGVVVGLVIGKLVGVLLGAALAARTPWAELPPGLTHKQLGGGAALAGIGFTISLFIVDLALEDPALQDQARIGVFAASLIAAGLGAASSTSAEPMPRSADRPSSCCARSIPPATTSAAGSMRR